MNVFEYDDFNQLYTDFNKSILLNPNLIRCLTGTMGLLHPTHLIAYDTNCDKINLGELGYKAKKWNNLLGTYLGPDRHVLDELQKIKTLGGLSCSFDFHRKKVGNGACMLTISLTRNERKKPWDRAYITFRSSETHNKLPVDLILISKLLDYIPNCEIEETHFIMIQPFQNAVGVQPMARFLWDIEVEKLPRYNKKPEYNKYIKTIISRKESYFDNRESTVKQLSAGKRAIQLYRDFEDGKELPIITTKELKLI